MAAGELGKAIEERVAAFERGQEELRAGAGTGREIIQGQQGQLREDFLRQQGLTEGGFNPFIQAGTGALQDVQQGSTIGGLDERIAQILGSGAFQGLREERFGDINRQLASSGLSRSGLGLEQIANISPDLAFQIENQQFGRSRDLSNVGFQGVERRGALGNQLTLGQGGLASRLTGLEAQIANQLGINLAGGEVGIGEAQASGRELGLQQEADFLGQALGLVGTVGGAFVGGPLGASIGGSLASAIGGGGSGGGGTPSISGIGSSLRGPGGQFFSSGISSGASSF